MCLVLWSNDSGININQRFCERTCSSVTTSYNNCKSPFYSTFDPYEKTHYYAKSRGRRLCSIMEKNLRVRKFLHNANLYARRTVLRVFLNGRQRRPRFICSKITRLLDQIAMAICMLESDSELLLSCRKHLTKYHESNTAVTHKCKDGGIMVWAEISLNVTMTNMCSIEKL